MTEEEIGKLIIQTGSVVLILCLIFSSFPYNSDKSTAYPDNFTFIGTRANDTVNYTQMALDFVEEHYPNKTYEVVSNSTIIPYRETGISYEYVVIDIIPGEDSPEDSVGVTVRHDTLNTEFGQEQYMKDYNEYWDNLPNYYKKMWKEGRVIILEYYGYYPEINDPALETYNASFIIYYEITSQTLLTSFMEENNFVYSIKNTTTGSPYLITNLSLNNILLIANQTYVQHVEHDIEIQFIPASSNGDGELSIPQLIGISIVALASIITILALIKYIKRNKKIYFKGGKGDVAHVQTKEKI